MERSNQAVGVSDGVSAASPGAAVAAKSGTLSVSTDPSPLVFTIFDHSMTAVAQGVSPDQVQLPAGLYMVRVARAGHPDLIRLAWVVSNATRSVRLSESAPNIFSAWTSAFFRQVDEKLRKLPPLPAAGAAPSPERPEAAREQFWIRFRKLTEWSVNEPVEPMRFSTRYDQDKTIIEVINPVRRVVFAQVARPGLPTVNVAIPPAGTRPGRCDLVVSPGDDLLQAHVRLATEWANSALQYMTQGYLEEAKQLIDSPKANEPSGLAGFLSRITSRFEDPAAALVPRYLRLRTGEDTFINTVGQQLLDSFQQELSDALVIAAELAGRERQYKLAAQKILNIRPGAVPLFTEGFSLLIHRLRELIDLDEEIPNLPANHRLEEGQTEKLKELMSALSRWAPFLNLNSPTVTFRGDDLAAPDGKQNQVTPVAADGWTSISAPP